MTTTDKVRAVRNNNPGNIEKSKDPWQGLQKPADMTPEQRAEKRFAVFAAPKWGFRAIARTLITYQDKKKAKDGSKIDTIEEAIDRWAPPSENDTEAYVKGVDRGHPKRRADHLDFHKYEDLAPLVKGIAIREAGGWYWDDEDLDAGLALAGAERPEPLVS